MKLHLDSNIFASRYKRAARLKRKCPQKLNLRLCKVDASTYEALPGAVFTLSRCGTVVDSVASDSKGQACFRVIPMQKYLLEETTAPPGYILTGQIYEVMVDRCGRIYVDGNCVPKFNIGNYTEQNFGSFTAIKRRLPSDLPLGGAGFTLYSSGQEIATSVSNDDGEVTFSDLQPGIYELVETVTPPGYQPSSEPLTVFVDSNHIVTINGLPADNFDLYNIPLYSFVFQKVAMPTNVPLSGATFTLSQNGTVIETATSDVNGFVNLGLIPPGVYTLTETSTPPGYIDSGATYTVEVTPPGMITIDGIPLSDFVAGNIAFAGFSVLKVDASNQSPLAGAIFTLSQNGIILESSTSNSLGIAGFSNLSPGQYLLQETTPPAGYLPDATIHTVIVDGLGSVMIDGLPVPQEGFVVNDTVSTATIILRYEDESGNQILASSVYTVAEGPYGPYSPNNIDGYIFVGLKAWSDPAQGTIAAGETKIITFVYEQGGLILIRYSGDEGCESIYPEQDITVPAGPYSVTVPVGRHPYPGDVKRYYLLMLGEGPPMSGTIAVGQTITINLECGIYTCPGASVFDPDRAVCVFPNA